jgi:glycosyltransferase involved in cell wall biosynthesis
MKPLLSIAIATKNRVPYCINTIETILNYKSTNFELVIQDNTDTVELGEYVKNNFYDPRLVYNYIPPPFSSIDNFNAVLSLCTGKYVCLLGDDDGILDNIFDVVEWANENKIDSICPKMFINYMWPNDNSNGRLVFPNSSLNLWYNKPYNNLQKLVNDGVLLYTKFNLPKLYHGIIKKSKLNEIKTRTGYYLGGLSPDIYSCVALAGIVQKHVVLDFPVTIAGACPASTTVDNTKGTHSGNLENAPHFRNRNGYMWDSHVPQYYSVQTIWADSALHSIDDCNINVDLSKLNRLKMLAGAINDNKGYKDFFIEKTLINLKKDKADFSFRVKLLYYQIILIFQNYYSKVLARIPFGKLISTKRIYNIQNIFECTEICNKILKNYNFREVLSKSNGKYKDV